MKKSKKLISIKFVKFMKKYKLPTTLYYILYISLSVAQNEPVGYLSIDNHNNMNIYLDSILVANHSFTNLSLNPGRYTIRADYQGSTSWLPAGYQKSIEILPDSCIKLNLDLTTFINIASQPYGAGLFLDEKFIATTPVLLNKDDYLNHTLLIKKDGYQDRRININENENKYNIILHTSKGNRTVLKGKQDKKYLSWKKEGLVISSIVTSWMAFLLKRQADHYYDKYTTTSNPALIEKYYNNTKKYDLYADIALGVSIISLGTYFYFLIHR
jgi:hypothetical protein